MMDHASTVATRSEDARNRGAIASPDSHDKRAATLRRATAIALKILLPIVSIIALWYLAIHTSGLPRYVIPEPMSVVRSLIDNRALFFEHFLYTLEVAMMGYLLANVIGIGLAVLFVAIPFSRDAVMPAAIAVRNLPYVIIVTVLALAMGDGFWTKVIIVTMGGFFPVLVNTYRGLLSVDSIILDRMRILDATLWDVFCRVRLPCSVPYIIAAQEITGSSSIIIAISVEWMISRSGLGYLINQSMMAYAGERVYAIAVIATAFSFFAYTLIHFVGTRLNWAEAKDR
jgi:NitT/TauT family transport system permease protein